uniref:MARVEL domain-containing protein n=1 Tax=Panagrellus redivivus TaxID=6233 RepID=A0A7E4UVN8_PANRE
MFRPKYPDTVQPEYTELCNVHIRLLASILIILYLFGATLVLIGCVIYKTILIPFPLILIALYIAVLVADKYEQPFLYLPFLVIQTLLLLSGGAILVYLVVTICRSNEYFAGETDELSKDEIKSRANDWRAMLGILIACLVVSEIFGIYIWNIVRRARRYMIKEVTSGKVERNAKSIGYNFNEVMTEEGKF